MALVPPNTTRDDNELPRRWANLLTNYTRAISVPYWDAESNGLYRGEREYSRFPRLLTLCISTNHPSLEITQDQLLERREILDLGQRINSVRLTIILDVALLK